MGFSVGLMGRGDTGSTLCPCTGVWRAGGGGRGGGEEGGREEGTGGGNMRREEETGGGRMPGWLQAVAEMQEEP